MIPIVTSNYDDVVVRREDLIWIEFRLSGHNSIRARERVQLVKRMLP